MKLCAAVLCVLLILACAAISADVGIHRMIANGRVFELQDTLQITTRADGEVGGAWISPDGKYVAYMDTQGDERVGLVRSSGGRPSILMEAPKDRTARVQFWLPRSHSGPDECHPAWSPDSRLVAFYAVLLTPDGPEDSVYYAIAHYVVVMTTAGQVRAQIVLPTGTRGIEPFYWSPDSHKLACVVRRGERSAGQPEQRTTDMLVLDTANGTAQPLCSKPDATMHIRRWSPDGKSLRCAVKDASGWQITEFYLDGRPDSLAETVKTLEDASPDGHWKKGDCKGLCIESCVSGEKKQVFKDATVDFLGWTPDSKLIMYQQGITVPDRSGKRSRELNSIWLAVAEDQRLNHMCVALDADKNSAYGFSSDGTKFAYVCQGRVCLAQLGWTDPDVFDKMAAGIPLTEDEEKELLVGSAKVIACAAFMYAEDHNGSFPSDAFMDELGPYVPGAGLFNRPGTDQMAFQYFPFGKMSDVGNPAETVLGSFDVGYGWQVILYADGHVIVQPK